MINFSTISKNFTSELTKAALGKKTSLPYIINSLSAKPFVKEGEVFQVLVIGGTIFRKAHVKKDGKNLTIVEKEEKYQPGFKHRHDFEKFIEKEISASVKSVSLNFAYPLKPVFSDDKLDGILISGKKENVFGGLVGKQVGNEIEKLIWNKRKQKIKVAVGNDTLCLLLAGLVKFDYSELVAGIVGTGMNFAFFLDEKHVVNLESASFDKFPQTPEAKLIDVHSTNPGVGIFEKEVAGAYLYKHYNLINEAKGLNFPSLHTTQELDQISQQNGSEEAKIAKSLLLNSASLVASQIAGILEYKKRDLVFVVEGSLFWLANGYRKQVANVLADISPNYKAKFTKIQESTIMGGAKLIA